MSYSKLGSVSLVYYSILPFLLSPKGSYGFKSYVTLGYGSQSPRSRLYDRNNEQLTQNREESSIIPQIDDFRSINHVQNQHHNAHNGFANNDDTLQHTTSHSLTNSLSPSVLGKKSQTPYYIPEDQINSILKLGSGENQKIVNFFGLWCFAMTIISCPPWAAAMSLVDMVCNSLKKLDPHRAVFDYTGKIWSRFYLRLINSYPTITGDIKWVKDNKGKACLYVANHASWIDIPILCTVLDPVFKFIAKADLNNVPCIGQQLVGGKHVLIDRDDRRSQLRAFKEGVNWLKSGVPVMAFPEGKRSKDGRLSDFKGGIFSMAVKAKVPIVPISISNAHAIMPTYSLMPVQPGANKLYVHVHPAIDTNVEGMTDKELSDRVFNAIASGLPSDQRPLSQIDNLFNHVARG